MGKQTLADLSRNDQVEVKAVGVRGVKSGLNHEGGEVTKKKPGQEKKRGSRQGEERFCSPILSSTLFPNLPFLRAFVPSW